MKNKNVSSWEKKEMALIKRNAKKYEISELQDQLDNNMVPEINKHYTDWLNV